jgi:galactokinase
MNTALQKTVIDAFKEAFGRDPEVLARAPGRVNILGAHVDYNEGWVLPGAIDRAVWVAAGSRADTELHVRSLDIGGQLSIDLRELPTEPGERPENRKVPGWAKLPLGVAWVLRSSGYYMRGTNAVFAGDVPIGAGVSSSAAVEIAFFMVWEALLDLAIDDLTRAKLGQKVENQYLGIGSGIMDQFASIHGEADKLILLDCRTLEYQMIPLPDNLSVIIADSGVRRELARSEYNLRREQCQEAVSILKRYLPDIRALRDVDQQEFQRLSDKLPTLIRKRARHVVDECARVRDGAKALTDDDLERFGDMIRRSHISSRDLYEVSIPELDVLAAAAWRNPGCYGARLTGAGFGGCVVGVVDREVVDDVSREMSIEFKNHFGRDPAIFATNIDDGASSRSLAR